MIGCHILMRCDDELIKTQQIEVKIYLRLMIIQLKDVPKEEDENGDGCDAYNFNDDEDATMMM